MENKKLNEQQSLELITRMINTTRERVERNAGMPFVIMGYLTTFVSIAVWTALTLTANYHWQYMWFVIPAGGLGYWLWRRNKEQQKEVMTYVDRIVGYVWNTLGVVGFVLSMYSIFVRIPILFIIILLMGLGTALTGLITRFHFCTVAGLLSALILAPLCLFVTNIDSILIFAAVFVVMMVIPGHILNYKSNRQQ
ncbi:MAG: hypothetical protein RSB23_05780 [Alistipes sp.]